MILYIRLRHCARLFCETPVMFLLYGIFLSVVTCFCWGSTSFLMRGIRKLDAAEMSLTRACGGLLCGALLLFAKNAQLTPVTRFEVFIFLALVICNNILGDVFLFFSIRLLGVARGSAISSTYPICVAIVSYLIYDAPLTPAIAGGTLSVVAGVALLCRKGKEERPLSFWGLASAAAASVFWAAGLLLNKELLVCGLNPATIVLGRGVAFFGAASAVWFFHAFFVKKKARPWRAFLRRDSALGVTAGACSLGLGAWFYSLALQYVPPTVATPIGASNPVLASLFSTLVYKDKIEPAQWAGIVLAVGGSVLVAL